MARFLSHTPAGSRRNERYHRLLKRIKLADSLNYQSRHKPDPDKREFDLDRATLKPRNRNPESETGNRKPESGIRNPESGIRNPVSGIRNPESGIRNPESTNQRKQVLNSNTQKLFFIAFASRK